AAHLAHRRPGRPDLRRQPRGRLAAHRRRAARPGADHARPAGRPEAGGDDRPQPAGVTAAAARPRHARGVPAATALALLVVALVLPAGPLAAQDSREAQRRLDRVKRELNEVGRERRRLEGQRGTASRELRQADERVDRNARELADTAAALARQEQALEALEARRDAAARGLSAQRTELAALLRAAYTVGGQAPLKLMLSQDDAAGASRSLAYHGYLQRSRSARIAELSAELSGLEEMERRIAAEREALA